jgi:anaerobic carbon-monoxide dehydrogenase iron sulfur subunit
MSKILMISPKKCNNCKTCEAVCSNSAVNVITFEEAEISVPVMCMQCEDAACMKVCPNGAIFRDENDAVAVDPKKCIGCKMCISACPMGNIDYSYSQKKIMKCNLCGANPACAKYCPTRAIEYVEGTTSNKTKKRVVASKFKELFEEALN